MWERNKCHVCKCYNKCHNSVHVVAEFCSHPLFCINWKSNTRIGGYINNQKVDLAENRTFKHAPLTFMPGEVSVWWRTPVAVYTFIYITELHRTQLQNFSGAYKSLWISNCSIGQTHTSYIKRQKGLFWVKTLNEKKLLKLEGAKVMKVCYSWSFWFDHQ